MGMDGGRHNGMEIERVLVYLSFISPVLGRLNVVAYDDMICMLTLCMGIGPPSTGPLTHSPSQE